MRASTEYDATEITTQFVKMMTNLLVVMHVHDMLTAVVCVEYCIRTQFATPQRHAAVEWILVKLHRLLHS